MKNDLRKNLILSISMIKAKVSTLEEQYSERAEWLMVEATERGMKSSCYERNTISTLAHMQEIKSEISGLSYALNYIEFLVDDKENGNEDDLR